MTHDTSRTDSNRPDNVLTPAQLAENVPGLLGLFRDGETRPVHFGERGQPEATIIPYAQFLRLVKYDTRAAAADRRMIEDRIADLDAGDYVDVTDDALKNLGTADDPRLERGDV